MARKKKKHEHVNHERWLVSYADFITLLFAFFVVMFAVSQVDSRKLGRFVESVNVAFQLRGVFQENQGSPLARGGGGNSIVTPVVSERPSFLEHSAASRRAADALETISTRLERAGVADVAIVRHDPRGVAVTLMADALFAPGTAAVREDAQATLFAVAIALRGERGPIQVEAHTGASDAPSPPWELSAARAGCVAAYLQEMGVAPERLAAIGLAGYHALEAALDPAARVDLVLVTEGQGGG